MSLSNDIKPYLPFLRRYARALTGSQAKGDDFVRATLEAIVAAPTDFPRDVDPRLGLYRTFHAICSLANIEDEPGLGEGDDPEEIARARLLRITPLSRQALLLTAMEGFTPEDAGYLIGASGAEVDSLVAEALAEIERQTRAEVLIIEDEPIIAMHIETVVRDLGHNVTDVAVTRDEAVAKARQRPPTLILADIQLADDSSGIDAVKDILAELKAPVIFITAFPERLLNSDRVEPAYLVTKPFESSTLKAAIAQALFLGLSDEPAKSAPPPQPDLAAIPAPLVEARRGPVNAAVIGGQLRLVDSARAETPLPERDLEAARRLHLTTARRLCSALAGSNVGAGFNARLDGVRRLLSRKLTNERGLQLGLQVRGLEAMMAKVAEFLSDATAADVEIFVSDLVELLNQFPNYRRFVAEALAAQPINDKSRNAAAEVARLLEQQPDELLDSRLRDAIGEVRNVAQTQAEPLATLALLRTVGNAFRAVGRFFNARITKLGSKATESFDDIAGKALGKGLALLLVGTPIAGLLTLLASRVPNEFAFVTQLLRAAKAILGL